VVTSFTFKTYLGKPELYDPLFRLPHKNALNSVTRTIVFGTQDQTNLSTTYFTIRDVANGKNLKCVRKFMDFIEVSPKDNTGVTNKCIVASEIVGSLSTRIGVIVALADL